MRTKVISKVFFTFVFLLFEVSFLFGQNVGNYGTLGGQGYFFFPQGVQNQSNFLPSSNFCPQSEDQQDITGSKTNVNQINQKQIPNVQRQNIVPQRQIPLSGSKFPSIVNSTQGQMPGSMCMECPSGVLPNMKTPKEGIQSGDKLGKVTPQYNKSQTEGLTNGTVQKVGSLGLSFTAKDYFDKLGVNLEEPKVVDGVYYKITPEKMYFVRLSGIDINRVVCPTEVENVIYSEEKGIKVSISGKNVFIKYLIQKVGDEVEISRTPVDIYIVCGRKVYSMIAIPERIPGVLVYLEDKEAELKSKIEGIKGTYIENRIIEIIRSVFSGKPVDGANLKLLDRDVNVYNELSIKEKAIYDLDFEGLRIRYFEITSKSNKDLRLTERQFLHSKITINPIALSLEKLTLKPGEKTFLIIIERNSGNLVGDLRN